MVVCLDTTVLVDVLGQSPRLRALVEELDDQVVVSAVSFYELFFGTENSGRRRRVEAFARDYAVIPAGYEVCEMAAEIQIRLRDTGELIPILDAIIAATAVLADADLVTADQHFRRIPPSFRLKLRSF